MSLKDVLGQNKAVEILLNEIRNGSVKHSYIFCGIKGVGKKFTAIQFAKSLICKNTKDGFSCDACESCNKIEEKLHPDVVLVDFNYQQQLLDKKEATSISIDTIRHIKQLSMLSSYEGGYKVFIIDQAETLQREAANSLLKILEEPPERCVFVLVVSMLGVLPKTIISRCELIKFLPLNNNVLRQVLSKNELRSVKSVFGSVEEINFIEKLEENFRFNSIAEIQQVIDNLPQDKEFIKYFFFRLVEDFFFNKYKSSLQHNKFLDEIEFFLKNFRYNVDVRLLMETFLMRYSILCSKNL